MCVCVCVCMCVFPLFLCPFFAFFLVFSRPYSLQLFFVRVCFLTHQFASYSYPLSSDAPASSICTTGRGHAKRWYSIQMYLLIHRLHFTSHPNFLVQKFSTSIKHPQCYSHHRYPGQPEKMKMRPLLHFLWSLCRPCRWIRHPWTSEDLSRVLPF